MNPHQQVDELKRLEALEKYRILDSESDSRFDEICALIANICETPMAFIGFMAADREWFKASFGWPLREVRRITSICTQTIKLNDLYIISDTQCNSDYCDSELVTGPPFIRFYAGMPIRTREGYAIGTLCILDRVVRTLTAAQTSALRILAHQVEALLELRRNISELEMVIEERAHIETALADTRRNMDMTLVELSKSIEATNKLMQARINTAFDGSQLSQYFDADFPGIFYLLSVDGCMLGWNRHLQEVIGYDADEILNRSATHFFETNELKTLVSEKIAIALREGSAAVEANLLTKSGLKIPYYLASAKIELGGKPFLVGMGIDISATYRSEESFQLRNRAMQASVNAIMITDLNAVVEYVNPAFEKMTGYHVVDIIGQNCKMLQGSDTQQPELDNLRNAMRERKDGSAVLRNYRKNGEMFWNDVQIAPVRNQAGIVTHFVGVINDITELKHYEIQLEERANFDSLTGLANRNLLKDRIRQTIMHAQRTRKIVTIGFIDLDNFKTINDTHGHNMGDHVLRTVAERLKACIRAEDTVARYGGDEFAFVLTEQATEENVAILMRRLLQTIAEPFMVGSENISISCSIGISFYPRDGVDVDSLLRQADVAMYRCKERGGNKFLFHTDQMTQKIVTRMSKEDKLRLALDANELALEYEPQLDVRSGVIVGAESRLVWRPVDGPPVYAAECFSLAEEAGLSIPIGEWVINRACADNKDLQELGLPPIRITVSLFPLQFRGCDLKKQLHNAFSCSGLEPRFLDLEMSENLLMQNPADSIQILSDLKEIGVMLTANDFGTAYSSLMYLQRFPLDALKIDSKFIEGIGCVPDDAPVARSIIWLAHSLDLRVIAEGVTKSEQALFLQANGCDEIEGNLVSAPLSTIKLQALLTKREVVT